MIYHFEEVTSTNDLAKEDSYSHGDVLWSESQTAGRGQRGHKWLSGKGLNLTFSVVLEPKNLKISQQFSILRITALAIVQTLSHFGIEAKIKWTNDIYVGDKKICGVLIENRNEGEFVKRSVIGIGLNINQIEFSPELPNPTSMNLASGKSFDREEVLKHLHKTLINLFDHQDEQLQNNYHNALYRLGKPHHFRGKSGEDFTATIKGVEPTGELILELENGETKAHIFGDVTFII